MAAITRVGYGQVEPNHLSAQRTGQIYAQLPLETGVNVLENGTFCVYDYANGKVTVGYDPAASRPEAFLHYSEEKLYDERLQSHKDFALKTADSTDGRIYPRMFKTNIGDIYTTNLFAAAADPAVGDYFQPNTNGLLAEMAAAPAAADKLVFRVVKRYTMPDGQEGVKIQRVQ